MSGGTSHVPHERRPESQEPVSSDASSQLNSVANLQNTTFVMPYAMLFTYQLMLMYDE